MKPLVFALSLLLIPPPTLGAGIDFIQAARQAGEAVQVCSPNDPMFVAGRAAARQFALQNGLIGAWTQGIDPPAEFLMAIAEENRYCWSQGWLSGAEEKKSRTTTFVVVGGLILVGLLVLAAYAEEDSGYYYASP